MNKIHNIQSEIKSIKQFSENLYEFKFEAPEGFVYTAGQFIGIRFIPTHTRAYSIVDVHNDLITLIVDVGPIQYGGKNSKYFIDAKVGDKVNLLGPYGRYGIKDPLADKVFISTGSGIAPFVPMIKSTIGACKVYNFFGVRYEKDDVAFPYFNDVMDNGLQYIRCVTREDPMDVLSKKGRVTEVVPQYDFDWKNMEFYLCGAEHMINDMMEVLKAKGAEKIYFEKY